MHRKRRERLPPSPGETKRCKRCLPRLPLAKIFVRDRCTFSQIGLTSNEETFLFHLARAQQFCFEQVILHRHRTEGRLPNGFLRLSSKEGTILFLVIVLSPSDNTVFASRARRNKEKVTTAANLRRTSWEPDRATCPLIRCALSRSQSSRRDSLASGFSRSGRRESMRGSWDKKGEKGELKVA